MDGPPGATGAQGIPGASGGTVGPAGGSLFTNVAAQANLPAAASYTGVGYYVTGTKTAWISDGTTWRLVYGDTQHRDISSLMDSAWKLGAVGGGHLRLRRIENVIWISGRLQRIAAGGAYGGQPVFTAPAGFLPNAAYCPLGNVMLGSGKALGIVANLFGANRIDLYFYNVPGGAYVVDEYVQFTASWVTTDAWPTTLPGV